MDQTTTGQLRRRAARRRGRLARMLARGHAGMSLIEIMVVVIIMGLITSAVGFGVFQQLKKAKIKQAQQGIDLIRSAVRLYENDHPGQCPTVEQLQSDGVLDRAKSSSDPWGRPYRIVCENGDVAVSCDGPDGQQGSSDDIGAQAPGGGGTGG